MNINIIVAYCKNNGIGLNNSLPWKISSDLKKFKNLTIGNGNNAIIMGKNTWLSLNSSPLTKRDNLILSNTLDIDKTCNTNIVKSFKNIEELKDFIYLKSYSDVWIITANLEAIKSIGLKSSKKIKLFNANLESRLLNYKIYPGSKKHKD